MSLKLQLGRRKENYSLEQVSGRLSDEFEEEIFVEDVLELALNGDLPISVQVYGAQKVMPLSKGFKKGIQNLPSLSPLSGYRTGLKDAENDTPGIIGPGVYQVGVHAPGINQYLSGLIGGQALGTVETRSWYLIMEDAEDGESHFYVPLEPVEEIKPLPFPSCQSLLVRREDLENSIVKLSEHAPENSASDKQELRALETLGLLTELFSQKAPKYQIGPDDRPNCAQIADAMERQAGGDVPGFRQGKLQRLLGRALSEWKNKSN